MKTQDRLEADPSPSGRPDSRAGGKVSGTLYALLCASNAAMGFARRGRRNRQGKRLDPGADAAVQTATLANAAAIVKHWREIESLRGRVGAEDDVLLDPIHFLAATDDTRRSCSVACWRQGRLIGLVYATEHYVHGLASGYAIGGDYTGRGLLLCMPEDESIVLKHCIQRMISDGVHSLHLRYLPRNEFRMAADGTIDGMTVDRIKMVSLDATIPGDRLRLKPDFEEFLGSLGKHTRRNIRACMRKTEELGMRFEPSLSADEYRAALQRLNSETTFPAEALRLARDERLLALHEGMRFGLRAEDGTLVSVLCGFRRRDRFHLLTQLNDMKYERLSLSLVLRSHAIQHLIMAGNTEIQFMGGSSLSLGRYCLPERYRSIFIDKRGGIAATVKQVCSWIVSVMTRLGRPAPERLAVLCNGHLGELQLSERTALRPAAMLRNRQAS